jgi:UrcA family protein
MKLVIPVSLVALGLGALVSVNAQGIQEVVVTGGKAAVGTETHSQTVKFGDLDLSKSEGQKALLSRIRSAAGEVCGQKPETNDAKGSSGYKKCVGEAVNGAVAKIGNPGLTALAK